MLLQPILKLSFVLTPAFDHPEPGRTIITIGKVFENDLNKVGFFEVEEIRSKEYHY